MLDRAAGTRRTAHGAHGVRTHPGDDPLSKRLAHMIRGRYEQKRAAMWWRFLISCPIALVVRCGPTAPTANDLTGYLMTATPAASCAGMYDRPVDVVVSRV